MNTFDGDRRTSYDKLVPFLDWAFVTKQREIRDHGKFKKAWPKVLKRLLAEHGWTPEELNVEIDRRRALVKL